MESRCIWTMNSRFEMVGWCWLLHFDWVNGTSLTHFYHFSTLPRRRELEAIFATRARCVSDRAKMGVGRSELMFDELLGKNIQELAPRRLIISTMWSLISTMSTFFCQPKNAQHFLWLNYLNSCSMWFNQVPLGSFRPQASHSASFFYAVSWSENRPGWGYRSTVVDLLGDWHKTW